jgi:hypothetical protein
LVRLGGYLRPRRAAPSCDTSKDVDAAKLEAKLSVHFCAKCGATIPSARVFKNCTNCGSPQNTDAVKIVLKVFAVLACVAVALLIRLAIWGPL